MLKRLGVYSLCSLVSYFVGNINPSFFLARKKGFDIREKGSRNAGASNAMIVMGKWIGVICALFDILKACFVVRMSARVFPLYRFVGIVSGVSCIFGHVFPVLMHFQGGKGLACTGGVILAYNYKVFIIMLLVEIIIVLITGYVTAVAPTASVIFTLLLYLREGLVYSLIFVPVIFVIYYRHWENFRRIRLGVEVRISYLWKKQEEQDRVEARWNELTDEEKAYVNMPTLNIDF